MSNGTPENEDLARRISKYSMLFLSAWNDVKEDLADGIINYPDNEHELRSLLFAKCLDLMKKDEFDIPFQIHAEDSRIYGKDLADLTLGDLGECDSSSRAVTVEIKLDPSSASVVSDIEKLQKYIAKDRLFRAFFVALGDIALQNVKLKISALGIAESDIDIDVGGVPLSRRRKVALCVSLGP